MDLTIDGIVVTTSLGNRSNFPHTFLSKVPVLHLVDSLVNCASGLRGWDI